jgi:enoyl-CoA hydratase
VNAVPDYRWLLYETIDDGRIALITLNRPRQRNAQSRGLLVELDQAFLAAQADDSVIPKTKHKPKAQA